MPHAELEHTDFIVVGAGVAGLRAAIELAAAGDVLVITKQEISESATQYAQGGIAAALSDEDEVSLHLQDTIAAGDGLVNEEAARILVEEGLERIQELLEWGTQFDRAGQGLAFTREAAHSRDRILHAHGDSTGREISRALAAKARTMPRIRFHEFEFTADLLLSDRGVCGVQLIAPDGAARQLQADSVLLATGGAGQVFRNTTNPSVATADGIAMAYRAGAAMEDMEFVQFHPTALYKPDAPRFLLSEALRGEGAYLVNGRNERFMQKYHRDGELAPRDVVARAIVTEIENTPDGKGGVFLDARHLRGKDLPRRFPRIYETCLRFGIDIASDLIPVRPAAHFIMGGVKTGLLGATNKPGLYAAGETACTGVHGANRLASNSLLEGLVFGARAGQAMRDKARKECAPPLPQEPQPGGHIAAADMRLMVQNIMWRHAGVKRDGPSLSAALGLLDNLRDRLPLPTSRENCEARNIHQAAWLILKSALAREESRGAHYRSDFPEKREVFRRHSTLAGGNVRFEK